MSIGLVDTRRPPAIMGRRLAGAKILRIRLRPRSSPSCSGRVALIVGLAAFILRDGKRQVFILSLLIGLSTAYQFSVANTYRRDTANQQDFFWQLAWRIPALEENTAPPTHEFPLKDVSDIQLTAPLNWIYAPQISDRKIPYVLLYLKTRFNPSTLQDHQSIDIKYRTVDFNGSTSNSLVIYKEADGCLRVLDFVYAIRIHTSRLLQLLPAERNPAF